jgi:CMP-N,N'-diacetyllegionaminic acid synthase
MNLKNKKIICIIIARGGSKGIKNKNLRIINGKPMIFWTISLAKKCKFLDSIWVSSDSKKILDYASKNKVNIIERPKKFSKDSSSSESAWKHSMKEIEKQGKNFDFVLAPQVTSPLRGQLDFYNGIQFFLKNKLDSLFSSTLIKDFFTWKKKGKKLISNYNFLKRKRRQQIKETYLENGSFYIFKKKGFYEKKNRLFGKIGTYIMPKINSYQIDDFEDINILDTLFKKRK